MTDDEMTRAERILAGQRRLDAATPKLPAEATRAERMLAEESLAYANKLLDAAVIAGDKQRIATMAEDGIVPPGYALMAIEVVQYDSPERRPRSVWLADRAKCAATSTERMAEIYQHEARVDDLKPANNEPMRELGEAVFDKDMTRYFEAMSELPCEAIGDELVCPDDTKLVAEYLDYEQLRPVLRLGRGVKL